MVGDLTPYDRARRDHHIAAEARAGQDHRSRPQPATGTDRNLFGARPLLADRLVRVVVTVVGRGDVHVRTAVRVRADRHSRVGDDMAAAPQDDSVAQRQNRIGAQVEAGHHPRGQRDLLADDAVVAELDPGLTEDRALRKGEPGAGAEPPETQPPRLLHGDSARFLHPAPPAVDGGRDDAPPPGGERCERVSVLRHPHTVVAGT
jgi:hypothetical protein